MKLLFDENLSPKLSNRLSDLFPSSLHVRDMGMKATIDPTVWDYAKDNDLMIVLKDADMHDLSLVFGNLPKVIESLSSRNRPLRFRPLRNLCLPYVQHLFYRLLPAILIALPSAVASHLLTDRRVFNQVH